MSRHTRTSHKSQIASFILGCVRNLILILCVGALGGQFISSLTGGFPLTGSAEAASGVAAHTDAEIDDFVQTGELPPEEIRTVASTVLHASSQLDTYPAIASGADAPTPNPLPLFDDVPLLDDFRLSVMNGNSAQITGVWVDGILAYKVLPGSTNIAPNQQNTASIYQWADDHGVTALLIHNYLGGTRLYSLNAGVRIALIYGNGGVDWYLSRGGTWYEARNYPASGFKGPFRKWSCSENANSIFPSRISNGDIMQGCHTWLSRPALKVKDGWDS